MTPYHSPVPDPRPRRWLTQFLFWTAVALFFTSQAMAWMASMDEGRKYTLLQRFTHQLPVNLFTYYLYWATLPVYVWMKRRFPLDGGRWRPGILVHTLASVAFAAAHLVIVQYLIRLWYRRNELAAAIDIFGDWPRFPRGAAQFLAGNIHIDILTYWVILGVFYLLDYQRRWRERELKAAQLERELTAAELQALKAQLHPHFLFNTLNSIASLMHSDVETADTMLVRLSDLLRRALESAGAQEVTLRQELDFLRPYLEIEQIRFQDRLAVDFDIPESALEARVPNLILQPLVENAIKHGIAPQPGPGRIAVRARREGERLRLEVEDNGRGLDEAPRDGVGLANTRARLARLYGGESAFELAAGTAGGLTARVTLPFRPA